MINEYSVGRAALGIDGIVTCHIPQYPSEQLFLYFLAPKRPSRLHIKTICIKLKLPYLRSGNLHELRQSFLHAWLRFRGHQNVVLQYTVFCSVSLWFEVLESKFRQGFYSIMNRGNRKTPRAPNRNCDPAKTSSITIMQLSRTWNLHFRDLDTSIHLDACVILALADLYFHSFIWPVASPVVRVKGIITIRTRNLQKLNAAPKINDDNPVPWATFLQYEQPSFLNPVCHFD